MIYWHAAGSTLVMLLLAAEAAAPRSWNFDGDAVGPLPAGWKVERARDDPGSRWQVVADDHDSKNHTLSQISSDLASDNGKRQFNLCISDSVFQDVELSVRVRANTGAVDQGGGLMWRYQDARNYYVCRWNPLEHSFRAYKVVDGVRSQMDSAKVPGGPGDWHTLRIVQFGRDLRGYFDGKLVLDVEDDQFADAGRIGLWTKADAVTDFDDLHAGVATADDLEEAPTPTD